MQVYRKLNKFHGPNISILSHEHAIELLNKYECIDKCITYPYKESFEISRKQNLITERDLIMVWLWLETLRRVDFKMSYFSP